MTRSTLLLLPALLLAACARGGAGETPESGRSAAPDGAAAPTLEFSARELPAGEEVSQPSASASGGEGRITVQGRLSAPDPCRRVRGSLGTEGEALVLRVEVAPGEGEMCIQRIAAFAYDATLRGVAPGTHLLRVVHAYPQTGWETQTVLEERVTVR